MGRLQHYLRPYLGYMILTMAIKLGGAYAELMIPDLMETILDKKVPAGDQRSIYIYGCLMLLCAFLCLACNIIANRMSARSSGQITRAIRHDLMDKLAHEKFPPLDREDINLLANEIDNVTDTIEDVLRCFYMYNIVEIYPSVVEFSKLIVKCCDMLLQTMKEFRNFKKSKLLSELIIEINRLEEAGDRLYTAYIGQLFTERPDPYTVMAWKEAYKYLERSCDTCEHVADIIESVIMKNS